jgi:hypothetical protein
MYIDIYEEVYEYLGFAYLVFQMFFESGSDGTFYDLFA